MCVIRDSAVVRHAQAMIIIRACARYVFVDEYKNWVSRAMGRRGRMMLWRGGGVVLWRNRVRGGGG